MRSALYEAELCYIDWAMQFVQTIRLFSVTDNDRPQLTPALCGNSEHDRVL